MKKLLFITYSLHFTGGVQQVLVSLANELSKEYDIDILVLDGHSDVSYQLETKVKIIVENTYGDTKSHQVLKLIDKYLNRIPKILKIKPYIYQYGVYCILKKWLKKNHHKYDYIISSWYMLSSMLSIMKNINNKTIAWEHTNYKVGGYFWFNIMRPYYKNLKAIIFINKESKKYYQTLNQTHKLIYNIIGLPFEGTPYISNEKKENIVLFVGRLEPEKNLKGLFKIFSNLSNPKDWKLYIIGDGTEKRYLELYKSNNKISNIELLGYKTKEQVHEYMKNSKILVLVSEKEGLPTVLIEAMFCSIVLVSYNSQYGPSDIINSKNGFLVDVHDEDTFKDKLQQLIDNEKLIEELGKSSYLESKKWEKENIVKQWKEILK